MRSWIRSGAVFQEIVEPARHRIVDAAGNYRDDEFIASITMSCQPRSSLSVQLS